MVQRLLCFARISAAHLVFMPGLTSTVLSELATTRTNTSPASGWFCLFKYLFTRSSMYVPSRVDCSPTMSKKKEKKKAGGENETLKIKKINQKNKSRQESNFVVVIQSCFLQQVIYYLLWKMHVPLQGIILPKLQAKSLKMNEEKPTDVLQWTCFLSVFLCSSSNSSRRWTWRQIDRWIDR